MRGNPGAPLYFSLRSFCDQHESFVPEILHQVSEVFANDVRRFCDERGLYLLLVTRLSSSGEGKWLQNPRSLATGPPPENSNR